MSNGRANESSEGGGGNGSAVDEPGGGPRRVVSETSVDDILASLDDGPANEPSDEPAADSTDAPPSESIDGTGAAGESARTASARPTDGPTDTTEPGAAHSEVADDPGTTTPSSETNEPDESGDGTELSYEDDDALAGRVAANDVTGADVRAAETDPGRESTPGIDDVDLSLDDLENAQTGGASTTESDGNASDDGPRDDEPDEEGNRTVDGDTGGVAGLFRRLFPWTR